MQGNRVLAEQDFEKVVVLPARFEALALYAHFQAGFPFQQVVRNLPHGCHVPVNVVRTRPAPVPRNVTSKLQCSEFSMLQWARAAIRHCSAEPASLPM